MGKWVCGSKASKLALKEDNQISPKNSVSTASSHEDKRDDHRVASHRRSHKNSRQRPAELDNSLIAASLPPPAAEAAFGGTPRFDWIDVEYHAATRVQTMFRRHLVLKEMEQAGMTTSYIRNQKRRRKARAFYPAVDDTPDMGFGCCSMQLAFGGNGDFDPADDIAYKDYRRKQYEEKTRAQREREEFLSTSYLEEKGIATKAQELDQSKFRDEMLLGL